MISLQTARRLKNAGLSWNPALHDFFAVPDRQLDQRIFVLSDMTIAVEVLHGAPAITFNGAVEWSLDYIYQNEVIWLPREDQLRALLLERLPDQDLTIHLTVDGDEWRCTFVTRTTTASYQDRDVSEAYAAALLGLLNKDDVP